MTATNLKIWRESASLILAAKSVFSQPNPYNYKILCLQRSSKSKFMPETYVFPGGNVSKSDQNLNWYKLYQSFGFNKQSFLDLRPTENIPEILQNDESETLPKYLSFRICAIRETFEECGILLCKTPKINSDTNSSWASFIGGQEIISWQHKVYENPEEFLNLCNHFQIVPDVWSLHNWSHWKTPPTLRGSKFNTIFFLATLHQMPNGHKDEKEAQDLMWTTPDQCIRLNHQHTTLLPPPQFYEMCRLQNVRDINTLSEFAKDRAKSGFETFWPYRIHTDDGIYTILPGDDLYPAKIDPECTDIPTIEALPDCKTKHRIFHTKEFLNFMEVNNFKSKCNHLTPVNKIHTKL